MRGLLVRALVVAATLVCCPALALAASAAAPIPAPLRPGAGGWFVSEPIRVAAGTRLVGVAWRSAAAAPVELRVVGRAGAPWVGLDRLGGFKGRSVSEPTWIGAAAIVELRSRSGLTGLSLVGVAPGATPAWQAPMLARIQAPGGGVAGPAILSRRAWGADESIRRSGPVYFDRLGVVFVHHTDNANGYAAPDVPAIIRGIYAYHVLQLGWWDIGYNYLIDAYGRIWEGRFGGVDRNVRGAHVEGFNTGSSGVGLIGTFDTQAPTTAQMAALNTLIAWRLDVAHVDPLGRTRLVSGGTAKYQAGTVATLSVISGHRDANYTDCPGTIVYQDLPGLRTAIASLPALRIYSPLASPVAIGFQATTFPILFHARLSSAAAWQVTVLDTHGQALVTFTGQGTTINQSWDGTLPGGARLPALSSLTWRIDATLAGASARPAAGAFNDLATPGTADLVSRVAAVPPVLLPAASTGTVTGAVTWTTRSAASIAAAIITSDGDTIRMLDPGTRRPAGTARLSWDGTNTTGTPAPSGHYAYQLRVGRPAGVATITIPIDVRRDLARLSVNPPLVVGAPRTITIRLTRLSAVGVDVRLLGAAGGARDISKIAPGPPGTTSIPLSTSGLADGRYQIQAGAISAGGAETLTAFLVVDHTPPRLFGLHLRTVRAAIRLDARLSKASYVTIFASHRRVFAAVLRRGRVRIVIPSSLAGTRTLVIRFRDLLGLRGRSITITIR